MSKRKKTSSGQAIVMVTLALFSMAGMMGLAVDLGWSYFVQKTAQASSDGAALAAVHEAWARKSGLSVGWSCGTGAAASYCQANAPTSCKTIQSDTSSNLYNGCLYARNIGFNYGSNSSRQDVTIQANVGTAFGGTAPPTVSGIAQVNMVYWVTVRSVQTIPQLFSSLLGNTQGTVAAIGTAAAVNTILPGSFYGLNREGDCLTDSAGAKYNCGMDIDVKSAGNMNCVDANGNSVGVNGKLCAAGGIFMASGCNGGTTNVAGCTDPGKGTANYAGNAANGALVWGGNSTQIRNAGSVPINQLGTGWSPAPGNSSDQSLFRDPTHTLPQPPLMTNGAIGTCGLPGGVIPDGSTLGPYQYYSYSVIGGVRIPDGKPITMTSNNGAATFASNGTCPDPSYQAGAAPKDGTFPAYIFYGGFILHGNSNTTVNFGTGQYVMAGTLNTPSNGCAGPCVFAVPNGGVINGSASGTMFLFTDANYPGLSTQMQAIPNYNNIQSQLINLVQGDVEMKNQDATMTGVQPAAGSDMAPYKNFLFWQDRRNSTVTCADDNGTANCSPSTSTQLQTNHVTNTSPRLILGTGGGAVNLTGVLYQPRGGWFELDGGGSSATGLLRLQLITGAFACNGGCGNASVTLLSPSAPVIQFVTALIQ